MPYTKIDEVPEQLRQHKGIPLTLGQANRLAEIADAIKRDSKTVKEPWALAWSVWMKEHKESDGKWVSVEKVNDKYLSNSIANQHLIDIGEHWHETDAEIRTTIHYGHDHGIEVDDEGDGKTTKDSGHYHYIADWVVQINENHTHKIPRSMRDIEIPEPENRLPPQRIPPRDFEDVYDEFSVAKPFGHPAGQLLQAKRIIALIPEHKKFCEPFAGSATIFFMKNPTDGPEVLNDMNPEYVRALTSLKTLTDSEIQSIIKKNWTGSKAYHDKIKVAKPPESKVDWLHWFLYKTTFSFGSMGKSFDNSDEGHTCTLNQVRRYEAIRNRMKNAEIVRKDWIDVVKEHDGPDTFFYIDPPYYKAKDKRAASFKIGEVDLDKFVEVLKGIKGKFICSIGNEEDWIVKLKSAGFQVQKITSPRSIPALAKGTKKSTQDWPLISNFTMKPEGKYSMEEFEVVDYDNNIYTPDALLKGINTSFVLPAIIHEVPDGLKCVIRKRGHEVTIHAIEEDGNEVDASMKFPILRNELSSLKDNFTLDAFINGWAEGYRKGKFYGEDRVLDYFSRKIKSNDSGLYATVYDLRWINDKCMKSETLTERLQCLEYSIGMTEHMKLIESNVVNNEMELMESVEFHARMSDSLGSMIRSSQSDHSHNGLIFRLHEVWSQDEINNLPDSAFALVESGGKKDESGRTTPRTLRHLPFRDSNGAIDIPHLRNAVARVSHVKLSNGEPIPREKRDEIVAKLRSLLDSMNKEKENGNNSSATWPKMPTQKSGHGVVESNIAEHSSMIDVYSIEEVKKYPGNPNSVEITGLFFHKGNHKGMNYDNERLKTIKLKPRPGESLVYFNFYHDKTEYLKAGIITDLWWDDKAEWIDPINNEHGVGAVMYKASITHPIAVNEILNDRIKNISAELYREVEYHSDNSPWAYDIDAVGGALTTSPQLPAADINEKCYTDPKSRKRVCV